MENITLETTRLILREYTLADLYRLHPILSDPITMSFWPAPFTFDQAREWIERSLASYAREGFGRYAVIGRESGELIGDCGIMRSTADGMSVNDLGYIIRKEDWGKGYATEASEGLKTLAFERLVLDALHANMAHDNHASRRVAEKIGMVKIREFDNERNRGIRTLLYELRE